MWVLRRQSWLAIPAHRCNLVTLVTYKLLQRSSSSQIATYRLVIKTVGQSVRPPRELSRAESNLWYRRYGALECNFPTSNHFPINTSFACRFSSFLFDLMINPPRYSDLGYFGTIGDWPGPHVFLGHGSHWNSLRTSTKWRGNCMQAYAWALVQVWSE
jgi:hypothetical protein